MDNTKAYENRLLFCEAILAVNLHCFNSSIPGSFDLDM